MSPSSKTLGALVGLLFVALSPASALQNGVGKLPVMGYNTWNAYACDIDSTLVINTAQYMKDHGLLNVGYNYVNLDDCWASKDRDANGQVVSAFVNITNSTVLDPVRFPSMNDLTDQLHSMGFRAGIYSDSGWFTCQGYPGSFMHEELDALTFQSWGFDYLKYDNCAIPFDDVIREGMVGKYQRMSDALETVAQLTGTAFVFSLCEWGWNQVWLWGASVGHSWRIDDDIYPNWDSIASIINVASFITQATDFYGHNDPDMLEVGNGDLTYDEAKTHFTAWALMKAPLLIGTNLATINSEMLGILKNTEIIAINQDPVYGTSISPFRWGINPNFMFNSSFPAQFWSGPSENGTVFMLINTLDQPADLKFNLTESPWIRAGREYAVRDLWTHTDNGTAVREYTAKAIPPHGVAALLLTDVGDEPWGLWPLCAGEAATQCTAENGTKYY